MGNKKKYRSIEQLKSRYGLMFVSPWIIGFILFFAFPLFKSIYFAFCDVTMDVNGVKTTFIGLESFKVLLNEDPDFTDQLFGSVGSIFYSLPVILLISVVLALLLNQKFRGRLFFRAVYFLPVIIATGVVVEIMFKSTSSDLTGAGVSNSLSDSMFSVDDVLLWLNLPSQAAKYVKLIINDIFNLLWSCGIQTVLFIAGLQSIPSTLYEASRVEGASKWEEFWFITFPMLGSVTLLVSVYTMVDLFTNRNNQLVSAIYDMMSSGTYDLTSTMLWIYFVLVGAVLGIILYLYNRFLMKRWQ